MLPLLFVAITQVQLRPVDVPPIVDAVLTEVYAGPVPRSRSGTERPLFVDVGATAKAFRESVVAGPLDTFPGAKRPYTALSEAQAIRCFRPATDVPASCEVANDGLFVTIQSAKAATALGEYQFMVRTRWTDTMRQGTQIIQGHNIEMVVTRKANEWRVVRSRVTRIVN
jgi:hypothetical protein